MAIESLVINFAFCVASVAVFPFLCKSISSIICSYRGVVSDEVESALVAKSSAKRLLMENAEKEKCVDAEIEEIISAAKKKSEIIESKAKIDSENLYKKNLQSLEEAIKKSRSQFLKRLISIAVLSAESSVSNFALDVDEEVQKKFLQKFYKKSNL